MTGAAPPNPLALPLALLAWYVQETSSPRELEAAIADHQDAASADPDEAYRVANDHIAQILANVAQLDEIPDDRDPLAGLVRDPRLGLVSVTNELRLARLRRDDALETVVTTFMAQRLLELMPSDAIEELTRELREDVLRCDDTITAGANWRLVHEIAINRLDAILSKRAARGR